MQTKKLPAFGIFVENIRHLCICLWYTWMVFHTSNLHALFKRSVKSQRDIGAKNRRDKYNNK